MSLNLPKNEPTYIKGKRISSITQSQKKYM